MKELQISQTINGQPINTSATAGRTAEEQRGIDLQNQELASWGLPPQSGVGFKRTVTITPAPTEETKP